MGRGWGSLGDGWREVTFADLEGESLRSNNFGWWLGSADRGGDWLLRFTMSVLPSSSLDWAPTIC